MSLPTKPDLVVYCLCANTGLVPDERKSEALSTLSAAGLPVEVVPDLCELAAKRDPRIAGWFSRSRVLVVACHPRAIRWLIRHAGVETCDGAIEVVNIRTEPAAAIGRRIPPSSAGTDSIPIPPPAPQTAGDWIPWFPVIDYDRCTQCRQCLSFCPFGVYELDSKRVVVRNPTSCKNNCPACARICPQVAIIFPKVKDSPIDGAEVTSEDVAKQRKSPVEGETDLRALLARRRMKAAAGRFARNLDAAPSGGRNQAENT